MITKFSQYIKEGVLISQDNTDYIKSKLLSIKDRLDRFEFDDKSFLFLLNKIFKNSKEDIGVGITFELNDENKYADKDLFVTNGGYVPRTKNAVMIFGKGYFNKVKEYIDNNSYESFVKKVCKIFSHELIHHEQWSKVDPKRYKEVMTKQILRRNRLGKPEAYFTNPGEMMSHASDLIRKLIDEGKNREEIEDMLRNPRKIKTHFSYVKNNDLISDKDFNRFVKYCYQYLEKYL